MANKLISLGNLTRYHQKLLENYDARVMARAPATGSNPDDAAYLQALFAKGRVILRPNAHYHIKTAIILPAGTDVDMNGAIIEYTGNQYSSAQPYCSGCGFLNTHWEGNEFKSVLEYSGRGNMRFKNGEFINCAFGFMHGHDITFEDITFGEVKTNHVFQLSACKNVSFLRCTFYGIALSKDNGTTEVINLDLSAYGQFIGEWFFPSGTATLDEYACRDITVDSCVFRTRNNSVYADVFGYHANFMQPYKDEVSPDPDKLKQIHKCIRAVNNYIYGIGPKTSGNTLYTTAFNIRHMMNSVFANNVCENIQSFAVIDHVRQVTISGNVIKKNSNNADAFDLQSSWHQWATGTVPKTIDGQTKMGYNTSNKNVNIAGNNYSRPIVTFNPDDASVYTKTDWIPNSGAKPRYSKDGVIVQLHGRIRPSKDLTLSGETEIMTLPSACRPSTTVAWISRGDSYGSANTRFSVLVKIKEDGKLSFTPLVASVSLTTASDIWIDGTYIM